MRLTIELTQGEYLQLAALAKSLREQASPQAQQAVTMETLGSALLLEGLAQRRTQWYADQARRADADCDLDALRVLEQARCAS